MAQQNIMKTTPQLARRSGHLWLPLYPVAREKGEGVRSWAWAPAPPV
jgi:hypothetical protein